MANLEPALPIRFVLVGTSHPGNVGSTARAMLTMDLRELALVACECDPLSAPARAMAAGADAVLDDALCFERLDEALADRTLVIGSTARRRSVPMPEWSPREAAERAQAELARGGRVALLFGRERTGLENDELQRCHASIHIPTSAQFSSLNLAAAVQVVAYELRVALLAASSEAAEAAVAEEGAEDRDRDPPASHEQLEHFFRHLDQALHAIDFHKGRAPDTVMRRLRRLYLRATPSERELRILRGILADSERMARLAAVASGPAG